MPENEIPPVLRGDIYCVKTKCLCCSCFMGYFCDIKCIFPGTASFMDAFSGNILKMGVF